MLNFTHLLLVSTALLSFMSAENSSQAGRLIGGCKGIKNTDIKEGAMVKEPPKTGCSNVHSGIIRVDIRALTAITAFVHTHCCL